MLGPVMKMRPDSFSAQLVAALARNTPAFRPRGSTSRPTRVDPPSGEVLADVAIFASMDAKVRQRVADLAVPRTYRQGEILFHEGAPGDSLILLRQGRVVVFRESSAGERTVLATPAAPEALGEISLLDGQPRAASAEAAEDCTALEISSTALRDLMRADQLVLAGVLRSVGALIRRQSQPNVEQTFLDLPDQVAKVLVRLTAGHREPTIAIELNQAQLAEMAGGSRQSVNQVIGAFASRGWLRTEGRRIVVTDLAALRRQAGLPPEPSIDRRIATLTDRQRALLERLAGGQTVAAAASAESMSLQTANRLIDQARETLGIRDPETAIRAYRDATVRHRQQD